MISLFHVLRPEFDVLKRRFRIDGYLWKTRKQSSAPAAGMADLFLRAQRRFVVPVERPGMRN